MTEKYIGIDIGGTTIKIASLNSTHDIIDKWSIDTNIKDNGTYILDSIIDSLKKYFIKKNFTSNDFVGIGIGIPGTVDSNKGTVIGAHNLNWNKKIHVEKILENSLNLPVNIDNDANAAALGEQLKGAGNQNSNIIFITLGTGVGGGIISNNEIVHGKNSAAGEIGHLTVNPNGFECTCGNIGCLETVASGTGIVNLAKKNLSSFSRETKLLTSLRQNKTIEAKDIINYAKENDSYAQFILNKMSFYLGLSCSYLANTLNPAIIIFGGGVSNAGKILIDYIEPHFRAYAFPNIRDHTQLRLATLGSDAGVIGASLLMENN